MQRLCIPFVLSRQVTTLTVTNMLGTRPVEDEAQLLGRSPGMMALREAVSRLASSEAPVLILGESGTGKELVARLLHRRSRRRNGPLVAVNCAAFPETLL